MGKVVVRGFSVSLDGFGAGPRQDLQNPLGVAGPEMFAWFMHTRTWLKQRGQEGGETGVDDEIAAQAMSGLGAWILGRNMFGPVRGPWPDESWKGWWGDEPPYHVPVFVLTHHARPSFTMKGNTTFHFVTDGIQAALARAKEAAGERDIRIGGGPATVRQYLREGLIDELQLTISPVLLGSGEPLFANIDLRALGYECVKHTPSVRAVAHIVLRKRP